MWILFHRMVFVHIRMKRVLFFLLISTTKELENGVFINGVLRNFYDLFVKNKLENFKFRIEFKWIEMGEFMYHQWIFEVCFKIILNILCQFCVLFFMPHSKLCWDMRNLGCSYRVVWGCLLMFSGVQIGLRI